MKQCKTCKHFNVGEEDDYNLANTCRHRSPQYMVHGRGLWPGVQPTDGCGDHEPADTPTGPYADDPHPARR